jgi:hypothetical protein
VGRDSLIPRARAFPEGHGRHQKNSQKTQEGRAQRMSPALSKKFYGKKFMWDGISYENGDQAVVAVEAYKKDGFETEMMVENEQVFIYTRRLTVVQSGN